LHAGHLSLIVGDVKQSIYRWRGSDWKLLHTLEKEIECTTIATLDHNWRSKRHIIDFNNVFFAHASARLIQHFTEEFVHLEDLSLQQELLQQVQQLGTVYQDVQQKQSSQRRQADSGYVHISFFKDTVKDMVSQGWREKVKKQLPVLIETLQEDGFALKDIAILVRSNAEGREIFQTLLHYQQSPQAKEGYQYDLVSNESLYLSHNPWVNLLLNALRYLVDETNTLAQAKLNYLHRVYVQKNKTPDPLHTCFQAQMGPVHLPQVIVYQREYLQQLPLYELVETLIERFQLYQTAATPFIQAFQDIVLDFITKETIDKAAFLTWWEEKGSQYTLPRTATHNAMHLMTVHQAKGLQFKVVIIPFCAWSLDHNMHCPPTLWCTTTTLPFANFPVLPVRYSIRLKDTLYARDYYEEYIQAYLDHLNLLYVAFTRPQDRLYVYAPYASTGRLKSIADLLYQTFSPSLTTPDASRNGSLQRHWNELKGVFSMGRPRSV